VDTGIDDQPLVTTQIVTPWVVAYVQEFFGCESMQGAELEDQGGSGTALSHWEKRIFMNDYMTGEASYNPVFSQLTLALFRDSGWYWTNYSVASPLYWGEGLGCNFTLDNCAFWPDTNGYRCELGAPDSCTFDLQAIGTCTTDQLCDDCYFTVPYSNGWCTSTDNEGIEPLTDYGEVYSTASRCYISTLYKYSPEAAQSQPICYPSACQSSTALKVKVDDFWYDCTLGTQIAAIDYGGTIDCPDTQVLCQDAPTDDTWPIFTTITPDSGEPGSVVTIVGSNFENITLVYVAGPCTDVIVQDSTTLVATLPTYNNIDNPSNFLTQKANVVVQAGSGKNSMAYKRFGLEFKLDKALADAALDWVKDNWWVVLIAGVCIIALIVFCHCCFCRKDKNNGTV